MGGAVVGVAVVFLGAGVEEGYAEVCLRARGEV